MQPHGRVHMACAVPMGMDDGEDPRHMACAMPMGMDGEVSDEDREQSGSAADSGTMVPPQLALGEDLPDSLATTDSGGATRTRGRPLKRHLTPVTVEHATAAIKMAIRGLSTDTKQILRSHGTLFPIKEALCVVRKEVEVALARELELLNVPPVPKGAQLTQAVEAAMREVLLGKHYHAAATSDAFAMKTVWQKLRDRKARRARRGRPHASCGPTPDGRCPTCGQTWPPCVEPAGEDPREALRDDTAMAVQPAVNDPGEALLRDDAATIQPEARTLSIARRSSAASRPALPC